MATTRTRTQPRTETKEQPAKARAQGSTQVKQPKKQAAQPNKSHQVPSRARQRYESARKYWRETYSEMKKITWPDKDTTRNLTIVVIAISVILGLVLGGVDAAFVRLWHLIP